MTPFLTEEEWLKAEKHAANTFKELRPEYLPCADNWDILLPELKKRVLNDQGESCDVQVYLDAFSVCRDKLKLKSSEDIPEKSLTEADIERMPADEYKRRVVIPEFQAAQRRKQQ